MSGGGAPGAPCLHASSARTSNAPRPRERRCPLSVFPSHSIRSSALLLSQRLEAQLGPSRLPPLPISLPRGVGVQRDADLLPRAPAHREGVARRQARPCVAVAGDRPGYVVQFSARSDLNRP